MDGGWLPDEAYEVLLYRTLHTRHAGPGTLLEHLRPPDQKVENGLFSTLKKAYTYTSSVHRTQPRANTFKLLLPLQIQTSPHHAARSSYYYYFWNHPGTAFMPESVDPFVGEMK
jgi:hypothetical protein